MRTISEAFVAIGSSPGLLVLVKATIAVALGLAAARIAQPSRASIRHLLLASTFAALVALPIAILLVPAIRLEIPTAAAVPSVPSPAIVPNQRTTTVNATGVAGIPAADNDQWIPSSNQVLTIIWAVGAALFLGALASALWRLRQMRRCGLPWLEGKTTLRALAVEAGVRRPIEVLIHDRILAPITCGWLRPAILPAEARGWSESDVQRALVHELEHIRRGDWAVHIMARAICASYWFHPLVWIAWRQLCLEAERACDDAVLQNADRADYAEQLVLLARGLANSVAPPALSMANRSDLSTRVSAILDIRQSRGRAGAFAALSILTVAAVAVLAIAPVRAVARAIQNDASAAVQKPAQSEPSRIDRDLLEAAENGAVGEIVQLLDSGANINATIDGDGSPLIVAARRGHLEAVQLLLNRGADPDLAVPGDGSPIIMAAREGHEEVVTLLIGHRASIDRVVDGDENALIQASGEGHLNVVKLLVSRGADVNARVWVDAGQQPSKGEWRTPLNMARKRKQTAVVDFLLSAGARE